MFLAALETSQTQDVTGFKQKTHTLNARGSVYAQNTQHFSRGLGYTLIQRIHTSTSRINQEVLEVRCKQMAYTLIITTFETERLDVSDATNPLPNWQFSPLSNRFIKINFKIPAFL
jgi:hypothetical protein